MAYQKKTQSIAINITCFPVKVLAIKRIATNRDYFALDDIISKGLPVL